AAGKVESKVLADTADGKTATFIVLMSERANLNSAYGMKDQDARGWYVYNTLRETAARTQAGLRATLDARGIKYRSWWIANALSVTGDRSVVEMLAARADVQVIEANRPMYLIEPVRVGTDKSSASESAPGSPNDVEWGVESVRAPEVWAMGYTGQGIVVAGADTGIQWTHTALKSHYRGWNGATADHNYNWWDAIDDEADPLDPCEPGSQEPCDGHSHGTHTVGTMVGDDGMGNQIGVAPGAQWMGCRNMVSLGVGFGAVFDTYAECFEFFLAPTKLDGTAPDATKRPHVINNSWGCPEGCAPTTLRDIIEASQASGILVEASAGNDGPACSTVDVPPAIHEASFTTGALDLDADTGLYVADFSSRGPVATDGSLRLKPNISAPGVDTRSAVIGDSDAEYDLYSGTSMAGPHVVGVVALLWSARPELVRQITETKVLLQMSANPGVDVIEPIPMCGDTTPEDIPNNYFGWGAVDAFNAIQRAQGIEPTATAILPTATPGTPTATPTACPIQFTDVPADHTFYASVRCLSCRHIIGGYPCGGINPDTDQAEPCTGNQPYYRPSSNVTRGQIAKIVAQSFEYNADPGGQIYADVKPGDPFFTWINRLTAQDVMNGYPCGGPGEPCENGSRPYFRPSSYATRGQLSKIVANAAAFHEFHNNQVFEDVPATQPFYMYIARLASRQIMTGYPCGGTNPDTGQAEPCGESNKPYFRPSSNVSRGQTAKIVANAAFPFCSTP
ncbi:MAG TPA: S8 family serine peptidase, partial [Chloroflexia bacterium]|nr:S8 family serine peptidase [Chloroflexia bacterium]